MSSGRVASSRWPRDVLVLALGVTSPIAAFALLRLVPAVDVLFHSLTFHLVVVSGLSACALVVALLAARAAGRSGNRSLALLGAGCLTVAIFMLGHGLVTPGVADRPMNLWVARFPVLALVGLAAFLAAALWPPAREAAAAGRRRTRTAVAAYGAGLASAVTAAVLWPAAGIGDVPLPGEELLRDGLSLAAAVLLVAAGAAYLRRWRLGRDRVQLSLVLAAWLSAEALFSLRFGELWRLSWWDYHALLLAGFGSAVYAIVAQYRQLRVIDDTLAGVGLHEPMDLIAHGYPEALRALVAAVEVKDRHTSGHSERVAAMSVRLGLRIGLGSGQVRDLAQGAVLHDIGKIGTADAVLNKPGPLTAEERAWIEQHPVAGWEIVRQAPSLHPALSVVRHHHERWDGRGYPDGLSGEDIPLPARIAAVADVWDALTSDRAYRPAWSAQQALDHIVAGAGSQFDPACVAAFVDVMAAQGVRPSGAAADTSVAGSATDCHRSPTR